MLAAVHSQGAADTQPYSLHAAEGPNWWWAGFFILFMLFCGFLMMNLFVGVVLDNFNARRDEEAIKQQPVRGFLSEEQQAWVRRQQKLVKVR